MANATAFYNSAFLSRLLTECAASGNEKALALVTSTPPVAWQHTHLNGRYTFRDRDQPIDLDAILQGRSWNDAVGLATLARQSPRLHACPAEPFAVQAENRWMLPRSMTCKDQSFDYSQMMENKEIIRSLAALAHDLRLEVFRALVVVGQQGITPGTMAEHLDVPAATLSFHLKELTNAGLVTQERQGRNLIYRASFQHMNSLIDYLTANCCQGEACLPASATSCKF